MTTKKISAFLMISLLGCDSSVENSNDANGGFRNKVIIEDSVLISIEMFNTQYRNSQNLREFTILDAGKPFENKYKNSGVNCIESIGCFANVSPSPTEFEAYYRSSGKRLICYDTRSNDIHTLENRMYEYDLYSGQTLAGHYICGFVSPSTIVEKIFHHQIFYYIGKGFELDVGGIQGTLTIHYK